MTTRKKPRGKSPNLKLVYVGSMTTTDSRTISVHNVRTWEFNGKQYNEALAFKDKTCKTVTRTDIDRFSISKRPAFYFDVTLTETFKDGYEVGVTTDVELKTTHGGDGFTPFLFPYSQEQVTGYIADYLLANRNMPDWLFEKLCRKRVIRDGLVRLQSLKGVVCLESQVESGFVPKDWALVLLDLEGNLYDWEKKLIVSP